ncbi:helix-turn-helix transcriptional regulator [Acidovorax sp. LjRoot129]|uniref:winged helix-turn-helix transcriptional regulator n=1 Tax=Acidovorax sp. LjRoot129 TaxID=3342260 RepID=UPI003ECF3585
MESSAGGSRQAGRGGSVDAVHAGLDAPAPRHASMCPVEDWLGFLGHRWNALILWHLQGAPLRHALLLERLPGITAKVLSERLTGLQERGLLTRVDIVAVPRGVAYGLTPAAQQLVPVLNQLEWWARGVSDERALTRLVSLPRGDVSGLIGVIGVAVRDR